MVKFVHAVLGQMICLRYYYGIEVMQRMNPQKPKKKDSDDLFSFSSFLMLAYILEVLFVVWYQKCIGFSYKVAFLDLTLMERAGRWLFIGIFTCNLLCYLYFIQGRRSIKALAIMVFFPAAVVLLLERGILFKELVFSLIFLAFLACGLEWYLVIVKRNLRRAQGRNVSIRYKSLFRRLVRNLFKRLVHFGYGYAALLLIGWAFIGMIGRNHVYSTNVAVQNPEQMADLFELNQAELMKLTDDTYGDLTLEEQLNVLQTVANMESAYLGVEPVQIMADCICDKGWGGYYEAHNRTITIDTELAQGDYGVGHAVHVVLHEMYHAYQWACVYSAIWDMVDGDLYFYRQVANWQKEFMDYKDYNQLTDDDERLDEYRNQQVEADAEKYAHSRIEVYFER